MNPWVISSRQSRFRSVGDLVRGLVVLGALVAGAALLARWQAETLAGRAHVIDGDSLRLAGREIRLRGIDAPELHQNCTRGGEPYRCGDVARAALAKAVTEGEVSCRLTGHDRYSRALGRCLVNGEDLNARMVRRGLAVAYGGYRNEEEAARREKIGLWAGSFEQPAEWRKGHPRPPR